MKQKYEAIFIIRCNEDSKKLEETIEKINNILTINSNNITSDFIYHVVMCSNDFCKKLFEENKK